jgi:GntR family transcriptional regulator/MocR family aminotransferase
LHIAATLRAGLSLNVDDVVRRAEAAGVGIYPLSRFCAEEPAQSGVVIGYGAIATSKVEEGLRRLAACFRSR